MQHRVNSIASTYLQIKMQWILIKCYFDLLYTLAKLQYMNWQFIEKYIENKVPTIAPLIYVFTGLFVYS